MTGVDGMLLALGASMLLTAARLAWGPTAADRIIAIDLLAILTVGVVALLAVRYRQPLLLDVALALALVAFLSTVALARLLASRRDGS